MDFYNLNEKIELNLKANEFYYNLYDRLQNKISFLILIYTFISFYIIEIIKYPFTIDNVCERNYYFLGLIFFVIALCYCIYFSYKLALPETMYFINDPKSFYCDLKDKYEEVVPDKTDNLINEYIKTSYLNECENTLDHNSKLYIRKSSYFYKNFIGFLFCIPIYVLFSSYVIIQKKADKNQIEITNFKEIITQLKSK